MAKDKEYQQLIHTARWQHLRKAVLTAHPLCQRCAKENIVTPATEVHHVKPVEEAHTRAERARRMYDPHNLVALCHDCHVKTHTELGRCGKEANRKRQAKHAAEIIEKFFGDSETGAGFLKRGTTE